MRVDILERLADLIRPALAWREASPGAKPPGAFDGRGFVVTQAMTSLTGSAGEDFASILRALGYRMERRPPLPVVAPPVPAAPQRRRKQQAAEALAAEAPTVATDTEAAAPRGSDRRGRAETTASVEPEVAAAAEAAVACRGRRRVRIRAAECGRGGCRGRCRRRSRRRRGRADRGRRRRAGCRGLELTLPDHPSESTDEAAASETATAAAEAAEPAVGRSGLRRGCRAAEPQLVEVWRPGGRSEERRPRHDRNPRHQAATARRSPRRQARRGAERGQPRERHGDFRTRSRRDDQRPPRPDVAASATGAPHEAAQPQRSQERARSGAENGRDGQGPGQERQQRHATRAAATAAGQVPRRGGRGETRTVRRTAIRHQRAAAARARAADRSQFAIRQAGGAERTADRESQGQLSGRQVEIRALARRGMREGSRVVERQRLDKWLWHARVVQARTSAAALVAAAMSASMACAKPRRAMR